MSKYRLLILLLGPIPIVAASVALTNWLRCEWVGPPAANHFLVSTAHAAERQTAPQRAPRGSEALTRACRATADRLGGSLGADCSSIVRPPFVLAGNLKTEELERWHEKTIAPSSRAMARRYFSTPPDEPITVLLFADESSYNSYAEKLFGDRQVSIYGYYKPQQRTLVMNIGTGGGTLVHELTHALAAYDFPRIPDWFNEGLASLHEQCQFREADDGPWIEGLPNWRLDGLQRAVRDGRMRPLAALIGDDDFRGRQEGLNYAQARYFCLYLQKHDLLEEFYRRFRKTVDKDPHGLETLSALLADKTWPELDREFAAWVLELERP